PHRHGRMATTGWPPPHSHHHIERPAPMAAPDSNTPNENPNGWRRPKRRAPATWLRPKRSAPDRTELNEYPHRLLRGPLDWATPTSGLAGPTRASRTAQTGPGQALASPTPAGPLARWPCGPLSAWPVQPSTARPTPAVVPGSSLSPDSSTTPGYAQPAPLPLRRYGSRWPSPGPPRPPWPAPAPGAPRSWSATRGGVGATNSALGRASGVVPTSSRTPPPQRPPPLRSRSTSAAPMRRRPSPPAGPPMGYRRTEPSHTGSSPAHGCVGRY